MDTLTTPFGQISILIDGRSVPYTAQECASVSDLCPDLLGRYRIAVDFPPDGKAHSISCVFTPTGPYERGPESGERLECQGFYNDRGEKLSIGLEGETGCGGDFAWAFHQYDYSVDYLENGMAYLILPETETKRYVFGIAWIDDVGRDGHENGSRDRDLETWFGADPTIPL